MTRVWSGAAFFALQVALFAQTNSNSPAVQEPPEEDVPRERVQEYVYNPLQAAKEMRVGNYYFKKGSYRAALRRFEEATKWDPNSAEAWYRIGEVHEKMKDATAAREAWKKFLEIESDGKQASAVRKKLDAKL